MMTSCLSASLRVLDGEHVGGGRLAMESTWSLSLLCLTQGLRPCLLLHGQDSAMDPMELFIDYALELFVCLLFIIIYYTLKTSTQKMCARKTAICMNYTNNHHK